MEEEFQLIWISEFSLPSPGAPETKLHWQGFLLLENGAGDCGREQVHLYRLLLSLFLDLKGKKLENALQTLNQPFH